MNSHRYRNRGPSGTLTSTFIVASLLLCCAPPEDNTPPKQPSEGAPSAKGLFLGPQKDAEKAERPGRPDLPRLAFHEHSRGLAVGGTWREHPLLHDFNGDGRDDIVASNREEDGLNAWTAPSGEGGDWTLSITGLPRDLMYGGSDAADLDGDGDQDLVFGAHLDGLRVFLNDGALSWTESSSQHENPFRMLDVRLGDLNGDEHLDVVGIGHFTSNGAGVYLGLGEGRFERAPESDAVFNARTFGTVVELADVDGDGDDDLFFCCKAGPRVFLTDQTEGDLSWTPASEGLPKTSIGNITRACLPVDLDGDGKHELITGELTDPQTPKEQLLTAAVYSFDPESSGWSLVDSGLPSQLSVTDAASADMDGDGHADLVLASIEEGVVVYKGDGALRFTLAGQIASAPNPRIALGDANGDGLVDLCMLHGATKSIPDGGGVQVFLNSDDVWTER